MKRGERKRKKKNRRGKVEKKSKVVEKIELKEQSEGILWARIIFRFQVKIPAY